MEKTLFIHGFGSCGSGTKAQLLEQHFGKENFLAPDLPMDPDACLDILTGLQAKFDIGLLIGSSLGGFLATVLNGHKPVPTVLVNPSVRPWHTLAPHVGWHDHWCTGDPFELRQAHLDRLQSLNRNQLHCDEQYLLLVTEGDEVLDYREALAHFEGHPAHVQPGDDHRFRALGDWLGEMDRFVSACRS